MTTREQKLYNESIVIDMTAPLADVKNNYTRYIKGGHTAIAATIFPTTSYSLDMTVDGIIRYYNRIKADPRLKEILTAEDIYAAKREGKTGIILAFQGCTHLQANIHLLDVFYRLGVRMMQLTYNIRNAVGDGCEEPHDAGLSKFGERVVKEMNRMGIMVDLAHTGIRTTMEAMEVSDKPCIFSHGNSRSVHNVPRNLTDEQVIKIAKNGGVVGVNGYPGFISTKKKPMLSDMLDHIDYYVKLVGIDHVGFGLDYAENQFGIMNDEDAMADYEAALADGVWSKESYPEPPYYYPDEIYVPDLMPNVVPALVARGYADSDIKKLLGENFMRVAKECW